MNPSPLGSCNVTAISSLEYSCGLILMPAKRPTTGTISQTRENSCGDMFTCTPDFNAVQSNTQRTRERASCQQAYATRGECAERRTEASRVHVQKSGTNRPALS